MSIEDRVRDLEDANLKTRTIIWVLGVIGIGLGAFSTYVWSTVNDVTNRISSAEILAEGLEIRLKNISESVSGIVKKTINEDVLVSSFSNESVLAQVQAQAVCTAIAPQRNTVMAILRRPTGKDSKGKNVSEKCSEVCPRYKMVGTGKVASKVGAVHVYNGMQPFQSSNDGITIAGLATHKYPASDNNANFGPNYCCCGG